MFRSSYEWGIDGDVVWVEDLDIGRSVTNDMENVLSEIALSVYDRTGRALDSFQVAYRDTFGAWDRVEILAVNIEQVRLDVNYLEGSRNPGYCSRGVKFNFAPLGAFSREEAVEKLTAKKKPD